MADHASINQRLGRVLQVNGPLVTADLPGTPNGEQVRLGDLRLTGEIIAREGSRAVVQVYENTESLKPGDSVEPLGFPLSVELGPGLLGHIFDGTQRPLARIGELHGDHIPRGLDVPSLDRETEWVFTPCTAMAPGSKVDPGIEIGTVAKQDALRPLWREFLTNHAALVAGLQPRRVLAPDKKWRLIAGPFANAAEATQACALFKKASQPCEATVYAGDSL